MMRCLRQKPDYETPEAAKRFRDFLCAGDRKAKQREVFL